MSAKKPRKARIEGSKVAREQPRKELQRGSVEAIIYDWYRRNFEDVTEGHVATTNPTIDDLMVRWFANLARRLGGDKLPGRPVAPSTGSNRKWLTSPFVHLDPVAALTAALDELDNGTITLEAHWAKAAGVDDRPVDAFAQWYDGPAPASARKAIEGVLRATPDAPTPNPELRSAEALMVLWHASLHPEDDSAASPLVPEASPEVERAMVLWVGDTAHRLGGDQLPGCAVGQDWYTHPFAHLCPGAMLAWCCLEDGNMNDGRLWGELAGVNPLAAQAFEFWYCGIVAPISTRAARAVRAVAPAPE